MRLLQRGSSLEPIRKRYCGAILFFALTFLVVVGVVVVSSRDDSAPNYTDTVESADPDMPIRDRVLPDSYYDDPWVYFVGDSFTEGTSQDSGRSALWTSIVCGERKWYERNLGVYGAGYATNGRDGKSYLGQIQGSRLEGADGVVVSGGINDALSDVSIDQIRSRISQTFTWIRSYAPQVPFTVLSVFKPSAGPSPRIEAIDDALRSEAQRVGAVFVRSPDSISGNAEVLGADGFQLNDRGHAVIAASVGPQIAEPTR